ncbi:hypothetical protein ACFVZC_32330 [Streptomyces marokkonensis]|uniref:Uncharacterized protein n=1 Tax=Streptomyces marokkonensis TaxID=324855 RepID=A0ABW6QFM8_9ACTN
MVERGPGDQQVQGDVEPGEGGVDDVHVLVGPPSADQAHGRLRSRDTEGIPGPDAFDIGDPVAFIGDGERPHLERQTGKAGGQLVAYGVGGREYPDTPFAVAGQAADQPQRGVLGGHELVDEPGVRPAEQPGGAVQGIAGAEHHHRGHGPRLPPDLAGDLGDGLP